MCKRTTDSICRPRESFLEEVTWEGLIRVSSSRQKVNKWRGLEVNTEARSAASNGTVEMRLERQAAARLVLSKLRRVLMKNWPNQMCMLNE